LNWSPPGYELEALLLAEACLVDHCVFNLFHATGQVLLLPAFISIDFISIKMLGFTLFNFEHQDWNSWVNAHFTRF